MSYTVKIARITMKRKKEKEIDKIFKLFIIKEWKWEKQWKIVNPAIYKKGVKK